MTTRTLPTCLLPEWSAQTAVLIAWPFTEGDFAPWLGETEATYIAIAAAVTRSQRLIILCRDALHRARVESLLPDPVSSGRIAFGIMPYDDVWVRDTAPLTVTSADGLVFLDFRFNGWGGKYAHADDAQLAERLHATGLLGPAPRIAVDLVLEGGSVETDGAGTLLTTTRCLLNPNRNPEFDRQGIEDRLRRYLGVTRILWLDHGHAEGDDTDAHIDTLARFCSPDTIAYTACAAPDDPLFADFEAMARQLANFRTASGEPYRLVPLPMPAPITGGDGRRLPATYANFLIINDAVLVPVYDDPADAVALDRLAACFPGRKMVAIDCLPLIRQYGSLHCMTMQFPKAMETS